MNAQILSIDDPVAIQWALDLLRAGYPIAFPTDTVYGVGVPALDSAALLRLYALKQRPLTQAIPVLLATPGDIAHVAYGLSDEAILLAQKHWPGGLTLVLHAAHHLPPELLAYGNTVAVRVPRHPWLQTLISLLGCPLAATSANLHGQPSATTAYQVAGYFGEELEVIFNGEETPGDLPSTIVDCTLNLPRLLRQGVVNLHEG